MTGTLVNKSLLAQELVLNSHGFPTFPNELYSEILSYLQPIPVPKVLWISETPDPYRHGTLLALSQTCRSLRSFFLRQVWERIEVFGGMWTLNGTIETKEKQRNRSGYMQRIGDKKFTEEILGQLETVTVRNPELGQYVRIIDIKFVNLSHKNIIIRELSQSLSLLPHVHTLQIRTTGRDLININLTQYSFSQIRTLCLQGDFKYGNILPAFPNVRSFMQSSTTGYFPLRDLQPYALQIEELGVFSSVGAVRPLEAIAQGFPRLCSISIDECRGDLNHLSFLPLHMICLSLTRRWDRHDSPRFSSTSDKTWEKWIGLAKKVLKKCPTHGDVPKRVIFAKGSNSVEIFPVFP